MSELGSHQPSEAEIASWFEGKNFTTDWTTWQFESWVDLFQPYRKPGMELLEIGSWEGRSSIFFLNYFPQSRLTCVDTFEGGDEHQSDYALDGLEQRFDHNIQSFAERISKIKARSRDALPALAIGSQQFDFAYVDGGHRAEDAFADALLTWPLIRRGGVVLFDDYEWGLEKPITERPKLGIDLALKHLEGQFELIFHDWQILIQKII